MDSLHFHFVSSFFSFFYPNVSCRIRYIAIYIRLCGAKAFKYVHTSVYSIHTNTNHSYQFMHIHTNNNAWHVHELQYDSLLRLCQFIRNQCIFIWLPENLRCFLFFLYLIRNKHSRFDSTLIQPSLYSFQVYFNIIRRVALKLENKTILCVYVLLCFICFPCFCLHFSCQKNFPLLLLST